MSEIKCRNCGSRITLSCGGVTKRPYWRSRNGDRRCPERTNHVGHIPANVESIPDRVYQKAGAA